MNECPSRASAASHSDSMRWKIDFRKPCPRKRWRTTRLSIGAASSGCQVLAVALNHLVSERFELAGTGRQGRQCVAHGPRKLVQPRTRRLHAYQRWESRLVLGRVLARGLAERGAVAFEVEQVVADLEGKAERVA